MPLAGFGGWDVGLERSGLAKDLKVLEIHSLHRGVVGSKITLSIEP